MSTRSGSNTIVLDLRCLQDPNYASRGVGRHVLALLRHAPPSLRLVALTDPTLPALSPEARETVQETYVNAYSAGAPGRPLDPPIGVILTSPMTHDPIFAARLVSDPSLLRAAVVYDFIPRRRPDRYLPTAADQLRYALSLRWLARCDLFLPISRFSADDLIGLLNVPESAIAITGSPIDPVFEGPTTSEGAGAARHVLMAGGGDPRKNPEVVIHAHAQSPAMQSGAGIPLVLAGNYSEQDARAFRSLAVAFGGRPGLVETPGHVSDAALLKLYGQSLAIVCPSVDEGFSIPVVESMAAGAPCIVSDIPAHAELVVDSNYRFSPNDHGALRQKLEQAVADAGWRAAALARQAEIWPRFRAPIVAERFWNAVARRLPRRAPIVFRGHKPRVALLSPLPPDRSGVADYTLATCAELGRLVDLHVFTETVRPAPLRNVASVRPLNALAHLSKNFDRVISVVGNSHFHARIFEMLLRLGGACIAHDARMLSFYRFVLGKDRAIAVASMELRRPATEDELDEWLDDESKLQALFLGELAESAAPAVVHSPVTARMFQDRYGIVPAYLPFSIYRPWTTEELMPACRMAARARLGLEPGEIVIATFGFVHVTKAPEECVWMLEVLRGWGIPASLHFVGSLEETWAPGLRPLVASLGLERWVRFTEEFVSEQLYRDYLLGADLAVQLRTYGLGALSGALLDCAAAGLPTVTNLSLAEAVGVPSYVRSIPNALSPVLLGEAIAGLLDTGHTATRPENERRSYSKQRSFSSYARGLCQALTLDIRPDGADIRASVAA